MEITGIILEKWRSNPCHEDYQSQDIISPEASSFACLRGDERGCGKQIDLQSKKPTGG